jgi:uncharacterized membrane protein YccC
MRTNDDSEIKSQLSPKTMRVMWLIAFAASVVALALTVWSWIRKGHFDWPHIFTPLGIFFMSLGGLIDPKYGILYRVLGLLALVLIIIGISFLLMSNG